MARWISAPGYGDVMPRWLYYLIIMAVVAPIIEVIWGPQQEMAIFIFSAISLIPLAALIGRATEDLEYYVGPIAGGLLNATFGNAPEIIIGIFALQQGLILVVKASITGSIISNALLVLGSSLALGGWRWGKQSGRQPSPLRVPGYHQRPTSRGCRGSRRSRIM